MAGRLRLHTAVRSRNALSEMENVIATVDDKTAVALLNARNTTGQTPLHLAARLADSSPACFLLDLARSHSIKLNFESFVSARDNYGWTSLSHACDAGSISCVELLAPISDTAAETVFRQRCFEIASDHDEEHQAGPQILRVLLESLQSSSVPTRVARAGESDEEEVFDLATAARELGRAIDEKTQALRDVMSCDQESEDDSIDPAGKGADNFELTRGRSVLSKLEAQVHRQKAIIDAQSAIIERQAKVIESLTGSSHAPRIEPAIE